MKTIKFALKIILIFSFHFILNDYYKFSLLAIPKKEKEENFITHKGNGKLKINCNIVGSRIYINNKYIGDSPAEYAFEYEVVLKKDTGLTIYNSNPLNIRIEKVDYITSSKAWIIEDCLDEPEKWPLNCEVYLRLEKHPYKAGKLNLEYRYSVLPKIFFDELLTKSVKEAEQEVIDKILYWKKLIKKYPDSFSSKANYNILLKEYEDMLRQIKQLKKKETNLDNRFGFTAENVTEERILYYNLKEGIQGVVVTDGCENCDARKKGIKEGQVIIEVNETKIESFLDFYNEIIKHKEREVVRFQVVQNDGKKIYILKSKEIISL